MLLEDAYKFATTDIELEPHLADFIIDWGRLHIPDDVLTDHGREDKIHVTVKYGLLAKDVPPELQKIAQQTPQFRVFMGNVSLFTTNPKFDVVKIDVESPELHQLNKLITNAVPNETTYPDYHPHITIAYVEKGSCDHLNGEDPFEDPSVEREFTASGMRFRGAGDEDDPERVVTMLLFSKTPHVDRALAMAESYSKTASQTQERVVAMDMVESWRRIGLTQPEMLQRLKEGRWPTGMKYWANRAERPLTYNRLVREAMAQIDELTGEGPIQIDPFGGLGFPADSSRTKFFLAKRPKQVL